MHTACVTYYRDKITYIYMSRSLLADLNSNLLRRFWHEHTQIHLPCVPLMCMLKLCGTSQLYEYQHVKSDKV